MLILFLLKGHQRGQAQLFSCRSPRSNLMLLIEIGYGERRRNLSLSLLLRKRRKFPTRHDVCFMSQEARLVAM